MHPLAQLTLTQLEGPRFERSEKIPKTAFLIWTVHPYWDFYWSRKCKFVYTHNGYQFHIKRIVNGELLTDMRGFTEELNKCLKKKK